LIGEALMDFLKGRRHLPENIDELRIKMPK
jgi:hypothetical protein